jgi:hypothetical protein
MQKPKASQIKRQLLSLHNLRTDSKCCDSLGTCKTCGNWSEHWGTFRIEEPTLEILKPEPSAVVMVSDPEKGVAELS